MNFHALFNDLSVDNKNALNQYIELLKKATDVIKKWEEEEDTSITLLQLIEKSGLSKEAVDNYALPYMMTYRVPVPRNCVDILDKIAIDPKEDELKFSMKRISNNEPVTDTDRALVEQLGIQPVTVIDMIGFGSTLVFYLVMKSLNNDSDNSSQISPSDFGSYLMISLLFITTSALGGIIDTLSSFGDVMNTFARSLDENDNIGDNVIDLTKYLNPGSKNIH